MTHRPIRWLALTMTLAFSACEELPNLPPSASFVLSPVSPIIAGSSEVVFNASASRDDDGEIAAYVWNFGDGTPEQRTGTPTTTHVFPDTIARCVLVRYTVLLTVLDDDGGSGSANQVVDVIELPSPDSAECQT